MFRYATSVLVIIFSALVFKSESATLPSEIQKCHQDDEKCFMDRINEFLQKHPHGYPPLAIPDLEPVHLNNTISRNEKAGDNIELKINIKDIEMAGFTKLRNTKLTIKKGADDARLIELAMEGPELIAKGKYDVSGKILNLPIAGDGDFVFELTNPKFILREKLIPIERDGKKYNKVDKLAIKSEIEKLHLQLNNLFNGDKVLGDDLNKLINENWKLLWESLAPGNEKEIAQHLKNIMQDFYDKYSIDELFLD